MLASDMYTVPTPSTVRVHHHPVPQNADYAFPYLFKCPPEGIERSHHVALTPAVASTRPAAEEAHSQQQRPGEARALATPRARPRAARASAPR